MQCGSSSEETYASRPHPHVSTRLTQMFLTDTERRVHCECTLLCYLEQLDRRVLQYIGTSKPPCTFCDLYFAVYRKSKGVSLHTQKTHRRARGAWACPTFPGDDMLRTFLCEGLCEHIKAKIVDERRRRYELEWGPEPDDPHECE